MSLPKPYYQDSAVTLYHGDCREIVPLLGRFDLLLTDPPYGIGFKHSGISYGLGVSKTDTIYGDDAPFQPSEWLSYPSVMLWGADHFANRLPDGRWVVWDKLGGRDAFGDSFSDAEVAWINKKGAMRIYRHLWKGLLREGEGRGESRHHVSQKPVELMRYCLGLFPDAQTVLDPFAGSGTTGRACKDLGRKCTMIEREERYCEIAARRMGQEVLNLT